MLHLKNTQEETKTKGSSTDTAKIIFPILLKQQRLAGTHIQTHSHSGSECQNCVTPHFAKLVNAIQKSEPITLVLPAFPGKSPNLAKVLGTLPDMAETLALQNLQNLCDQIREVYTPGAKLILCSDGRVFSDVVGIQDTDITQYQDHLKKVIRDLALTSLCAFHLEDLNPTVRFDQMRAELVEHFGESLELLKASVKRGGSPKAAGASLNPEDAEANRLYCGITRFLVEDAQFPGQTLSRSAIQKDCRIRAYEVIRRSQAWSNLIEKRFPHAIRLSIHPQSCGGKKFGIQLVDQSAWVTPWHSVAVKLGKRFILLKRSQAEALGARLVSDDGRPSHYELPIGVILNGIENGR